MIEIFKTDGDLHRLRCTVCKLKSGPTRAQPEQFHHVCTDGRPAVALSPQETEELFGDTDPTLLGERIASLTSALGIPPCGGCEKRRAWLNKAHAWLRGKISGSSSDHPAADG